MELINDLLWVEDKPQFNSKFLNNRPNAIHVYLKSKSPKITRYNYSNRDKILDNYDYSNRDKVISKKNKDSQRLGNNRTLMRHLRNTPSPS